MPLHRRARCGCGLLWKGRDQAQQPSAIEADKVDRPGQLKRPSRRHDARLEPLDLLQVLRGDAGSGMVGAARFELATPCSRSKCATRLRYAPIRPLGTAVISRECGMRRYLVSAPRGGCSARGDAKGPYSGGARCLQAPDWGWIYGRPRPGKPTSGPRYAPRGPRHLDAVPKPLRAHCRANPATTPYRAQDVRAGAIAPAGPTDYVAAPAG